MLPLLRPNQLVIATGWFRQLAPSQVVIFQHDSREKIKRIERLDGERLFVTGDNKSQSLDSRSFGWLHRRQVLGRVIWPRL